MTVTDQTFLSMVLPDGRTIGDNLDRSVKAGTLIRRADNRFALPESALPDTARNPFIMNRSKEGFPPCGFLNHFLFSHAYGETTVPFGCRDCYKVKVVSRSLRQLMAVSSVVESLPCASKSGSEIDNPQNAHPYGTYLYLSGLDRAREIYRIVRERIDRHSALGTNVEMLIKRGCTNYELKCGPSDRYTFDPALEHVEAGLSRLFVKPVRRLAPKFRNAVALLSLIRIAYRIGDQTYKDFTGGKPLTRPTVTYPPDV